MINEQFQDPTIKEVHKKHMYELCMMGPATVYFQKLKEEAKLAGRWGNESDRGAMVRAVRAGVPASYTSFIANIGIGVPRTYSEWKTCILVMYEEHQKKLV